MRTRSTGSAGLRIAWLRPAAWRLLLVVAALSTAPSPSRGLELTLVARGSTWRYLDTETAPAAGWAAPEYDDRAWRLGQAQLGYGDGDERTVLGFGADPNAKPVSLYFRLAFPVSDAAAFTRLTWNLLRDDGAVVYLNGVEIRRDNLPSGAIGPATLASVAVGGAEESAYLATTSGAGLLRQGTNVLAVEVHQASRSSSDVSFDLELVASDAMPAVVRGPYLQLGTPAGAIVRWRTDLPTDSRVRYGLAADALTAEAASPTSTTEHAVALAGLAAATRYVYAIGNSKTLFDGGATHAFRTAPPTGTAARTRIWVIGDAGTGGSGQRAVRDAYATFAAGAAPDLWLMLGDNAYSSGTDVEYQVGVFDVYRQMLATSVLWPTFGNHDAVSADAATQSGPYYDLFTLPTAGEAGGAASGTEAYYAFDHGRVHFVCLDSSESARSPGCAMLTWLEADLSATRADWVIAFWHHPPYSKGSHDSDADPELALMRQIVLPILEAHGVDLVLAGHSHSYERSMLIDGHYGGSASLQSAMIVDGGDGRIEGDGAYRKPSPGQSAHEGTVYAAVGSSARVSGGSLDHPAMQVALNVLGSLVLDVDGQVLTGRFLTDSGALRDAFTIVKGAVGDVRLQGAVRYFRDQRPVPGALVTARVASAGDGRFALDAPIGAPVMLAPTRAGADGAVSALDAAWVLQAVAGLRPFDAVQRLACDVTGNGALSALDATEILRRSVGLSARLPAAALCDSDFVFVPAGAAAARIDRPPLLGNGSCRPGAIGFEPIVGAASAVDFLAAAFGDCTGNWRAAAAGAALRSRTDGPRIRAGRARRMADGRAVQTVVASGAPMLSALEFTVRVPPGAAVDTVRVGGDAVVRFASAANRVRIAVAAPRPVRTLRVQVVIDRLAAAQRPEIVGARIDEQPARLTRSP